PDFPLTFITISSKKQATVLGRSHYLDEKIFSKKKITSLLHVAKIRKMTFPLRVAESCKMTKKSSKFKKPRKKTQKKNQDKAIAYFRVIPNISA
ncbi:MAG: hypothetical protein ACI9TO_000400, partial [Rickettsiales bacterium]